MPWWVGALAAGAAGVALLVAFPPYGLWWLAPVGVALFTAAVHRRRWRAGAGSGVFGWLCVVCSVVELDQSAYVVMLPWLLLSGCRLVIWRCSVLVAASVGPLVDRFRWCVAGGDRAVVGGAGGVA